jgi:anti-anti-sigma factor
MSIEDWSHQVVIVHLGPDPSFSDDLQTLQERSTQESLDAVLDFSGVRYINSSQIARLLKLRKTISAGGQRMVLCGTDAQVWGAFLVTGLDKVFEFADAVPLALATLQMSRETRTT